MTLKRCICVGARRNIKHKSSGKFEFESTVRELARKKLQKYWKNPGIFRFLLSYFYPWKFQTKQNFPTGNSAKLCCYYPLRPKTKTTTRFTPVNSISFLINPWKFHLLPSVISNPGNSISSTKFLEWNSPVSWVYIVTLLARRSARKLFIQYSSVAISTVIIYTFLLLSLTNQLMSNLFINSQHFVW